MHTEDCSRTRRQECSGTAIPGSRDGFRPRTEALRGTAEVVNDCGDSLGVGAAEDQDVGPLEPAAASFFKSLEIQLMFPRVVRRRHAAWPVRKSVKAAGVFDALDDPVLAPASLAPAHQEIAPPQSAGVEKEIRPREGGLAGELQVEVLGRRCEGPLEGAPAIAGSHRESFPRWRRPFPCSWMGRRSLLSSGCVLR